MEDAVDGAVVAVDVEFVLALLLVPELAPDTAYLDVAPVEVVLSSGAQLM